MFGRKWKLHDEDASVIDNDTLPQRSNIRSMFKRLEALALSEIAQLIADCESTATVTYRYIMKMGAEN